METLIVTSNKISRPLLRITLGIVFLWVGLLKFANPEPVVGLLKASLPFLASNIFVYILGTFELGLALIFLSGKGVKYAAIMSIGLFAGTIFIFLIAPSVSYGEAGFPLLTLAGEFLLKDIVLLAVAVTLIGMDDEKAISPSKP